MINIDEYYIPNLYERFTYLRSYYEKDIKNDVHRSFPREKYFASPKYDLIGQRQLFNVLKAISLYLPNVGYCQGLNFVVGFLLLVNGGNEIEAFWAFVTIARDPRFLMMGFFEKGFPLIDFYIHLFFEVLKDELPEVHRHLTKQNIPDQLWVFKWFLTIFLYSLPPVHAIRIWDFIFAEGLMSIIKVGIAILKYI